MFDIDTLKVMSLENQQQRDWEKSERNRILRMSNQKKKQIEWNGLYPKLPVDNMVY